MLTYEVKIWSVRSRPSKSSPFQLRWKVGPEVHYLVFANKTLADGRRSQLMSAQRKGEQFDTETGLPASELRALNSPTWFAHACAYARMKWPNAAAKHRVGIAEALTNITPALTTSQKGAPEAKTLRLALRTWAFQMVKDDEGEWTPRKDVQEPPEEVAAALDWIAANSLKVKDLAVSDKLRPALKAISLTLKGKKAADNTVARKRTVLSNALRYAVERDLLDVNPLTRIDWSAPETDDEVDFRYVPEPKMARELIDAVRAQGPRGEHLYAFLGCMYYAANRPSEVADLKKSNLVLPAEGWGEMILAGSRPEVGSGWTDDGKPYEERGLKRRARRATRPVPIPPVLVQMLRDHIETQGLALDGRLFRAVRGGRVRSNEYTEIWQKARRKVLSEEEVATPLADVPYSLRHACVSLWIKAGVDPVEVARRAGHSIAVLWRFYAKILRGQQHKANELIDEALSG
ncbi:MULTISPECIES: tyrosine-type recombinase/integrase [unclassified Streptomyces]|uniref:tyrosine-type recombinase/integrase n=1 Tax=unclassified Streptomyces TaxID=2593676 RepID=UPI0024A8011C|nr:MULTISPECIES: tyrosine-type recombinase/integrase [unclassified Streptomyces]